MTFGLPPRHPAVLVACLTLAIGYLGLGFEAVGIASMDRPVWSDWSLLAISTAALPPITWLPLRMVARPQDFFQPARTVVAICEQPGRLVRVKTLGHVAQLLWLFALLYIGFQTATG